MFEYRDGSMIDGTMFRGWGRGEWGAPTTVGAGAGKAKSAKKENGIGSSR